MVVLWGCVTGVSRFWSDTPSAIEVGYLIDLKGVTEIEVRGVILCHPCVACVALVFNNLPGFAAGIDIRQKETHTSVCFFCCVFLCHRFSVSLCHIPYIGGVFS